MGLKDYDKSDRTEVVAWIGALILIGALVILDERVIGGLLAVVVGGYFMLKHGPLEVFTTVGYWLAVLTGVGIATAVLFCAVGVVVVVLQKRGIVNFEAKEMLE